MYRFGKKSKKKLKTCHRDIQTILNEVIRFYDFSVLEGIRTTERQQKLFAEGRTTLDGINKLSKHQHPSGVSHAVDIMPYYKGFNAFSSENGPKSFYYMAGLVQGIARKLYDEGKITHIIRWGGNWDSDMDFFDDSSFFDLPHFELIKP